MYANGQVHYSVPDKKSAFLADDTTVTATMGVKEHKKPRVVALGNPRYVGEDYIAGFRKDLDYSVLEAYDRKTTQELLPADIATHGEISAFIIRMGTPPYEPFDQDLLKALVPGCEIICSASAGYNEFDVDWMAADGMYFCNTVDAVAEATADMSMFLTLATLRNTSAAEASAKAGTWRDGGGLVPARDPSGMVLGIVGMGAIGKVAMFGHPVHMKLANDELSTSRRRQEPSICGSNTTIATNCHLKLRPSTQQRTAHPCTNSSQPPT